MDPHPWPGRSRGLGAERHPGPLLSQPAAARPLLVEHLDDQLLLVRLNRPEVLNALSRPLIEQLADALDQAQADVAVRGVVLAGAGRSFCAGVDLHEFAGGSAASGARLIRALQRLCATLRHLSKPVACAIQGHCLGGALEVAACCDVRVCTPEARLGMPEVFLGIPSVIDAVMLQHLIGVGRAHELLLTGELISGETALAWGLATRLGTADRLVEEAAEVLRRVTRHSAEVIAQQKALHAAWLELPYEAAVERSVAALVSAFAAGRPQPLAAARLGAW